MLDIFLPWLALRRLRQTLARRDREIDNLTREYFKRVATIKRLEERLSEAHFRDPKTGRIGKKGTSYE